MINQPLSIALKEWACTCRALAAGRQIMLLRKGGIHEAAGEFELDHLEFLLFPTYVHQKLEMIKPVDQSGVERREAEPAEVTISAAAKVTDIVQVRQRGQLDALDAEHIWTAALLDMRWNYRPENPLYVLLVRVFVLPAGKKIPNILEYAGCKSWVPLQQGISISDASPVLNDVEYEQRRQKVLSPL